MSLTLKICERAERLFTRFGIKSVSMDDVCKDLGISKKTLYNNVSDKEELIKNTLENHLITSEKMISEIIEHENDALNQMLKMGSVILERYKEMSPTMVFELKKYYPHLYQSIIEYKEKVIYNIITKNIVLGISQEFYKNNLNIELTAMFYIQLVDSCLNSELEILNKIDFNTKYSYMINYHLNSICTIKGLNKLKENENFK